MGKCVQFRRYISRYGNLFRKEYGLPQAASGLRNDSYVVAVSNTRNSEEFL